MFNPSITILNENISFHKHWRFVSSIYTILLRKLLTKSHYFIYFFQSWKKKLLMVSFIEPKLKLLGTLDFLSNIFSFCSRTILHCNFCISYKNMASILSKFFFLFYECKYWNSHSVFYVDICAVIWLFHRNTMMLFI